MKLNDIIEKLKENSKFKKWNEENPNCYLAHAFLMMDKANENTWQVGYYNKETDKMTTFILEKDDVKISPELNIFKKPNCTIEKLEIEKVKIGSIQAIETAEKVMEENYPKAIPQKMFFIIQNLKEQGPVYNITFITPDFQTVNIRMSTETGEVLNHKIENILDIKK